MSIGSVASIRLDITEDLACRCKRIPERAARNDSAFVYFQSDAIRVQQDDCFEHFMQRDAESIEIDNDNDIACSREVDQLRESLAALPSGSLIQ